MALFRDWEVLVAPFVTGASVPAIEDAVREAAIEFMQRTRMDTRVKGSLPYDPTEPDMPLPLVSAETTPYQCVNVWTTEGWVRPRIRREIDEQYPDGWVGETVTDPRDVWGWISLRPQLVRLVPALSVATVLRVEVVYQPKKTARQIDDYVLDLYGDAVAHGAVARLKRSVDTPYYDIAGAGAYEGKFQMEIDRLLSRAGTGHNKPRLQSAPDVFPRRRTS